MAGVDLSKFKPQSADDLLKGIWTQIGVVAIQDFNSFKKDMAGYLEALAKKAWNTQVLLKEGKISQEDADLALHTQELLLNNVLLYSKFTPYVVAQDVRDAAFSVISAAIKNLTGIDLKF